MTEILKDSTSHSPFFELVDSTTGLPKTGILYTDVTGSYCRSRGARVAVTMATLASASAAYSSGGFILVDDTNQPGVYRFDVPNAAFATGVEEVVVTVKATGCRTVSRAFTLTDISMQTAKVPATIAAGDFADISAVRAAKIDNLDVATSTRMATYTQPTGFLAATFPATVASTTNITAASGITVSSIEANVITASALAADAVAEIADGIWDEATSGHTTAGTYGGRIVRATNSNVEVQITGSNHVAADVHAFQTDVIDSSAIAASAVTEIQSGLSTLTQSQVTGGAYALNSASFAFNAAMDFTTTQKAATIAGVTTVTTTTDLTNLPAVTANWLTGTGIAASGVTKIQAGLATSDQLNSAVWAQTRFRFSIPEAVEVPESGTATYTLGITTYDASGALADLDSSPTIHAYYANGTSADALLSAVTRVTVGEYTIVLSVANGTTSPQFLRFVGSGAMSSVALGMTDYSWIVDNVAEGFTAGDRGNLDAIFDKLPTNNIADETLLEGILGTSGNAGTLGGAIDIAISEANSAHNIVADGTSGNPALYTILTSTGTILAASQPNNITFTGTVTIEPTTTDATALLLRGNGTGRALDIYSPNGHAVTMYAGLNAFDIYAQGNAIYAQSNTSDAVVLYAGGDANGLHVYGGQSSGSAVKLQTNGVGCGLEVLSGGEGFAAHIGGMKIDGVVTLETGLVITQTTASTAAVQIVGNGSGPGLDIQGGEYSDGIRARSGASYGYGFCVAGAQGGSRMWSTGANGTGLTLTGAGTGDGLFLNPGETGSGLHIYGGSTSGDAVHVETSGTGSVYFPVEGSGGGATVEEIRIEMDTNSTKLALIVADTNELQADWENGGRLDLILDARASQTSVDDLPTNAELATALGTSDDATLSAIAAEAVKTAAIKAKTDNLPSDPADQSLLMAAIAGGGTGARTVALTVNDGSAAIESAHVRVTKGAESYVLDTNASGLVTFSLDDGTWSIAITKPGYVYNNPSATIVVNGNETATYSMTQITITPSDPGQVTGFIYCYDEVGAVEEGVEIHLHQQRPISGTGIAYDDAVRTGTSDADGLVEFVGMFKGGRYSYYRGTSDDRHVEITVPTTATDPYELKSISGTD